MGVLAVRLAGLQGLHRELQWDGENMRFTNIPTGATIKNVVEDKFQIHDGHPTFDRSYTEPVDANVYAQQLIKPVYRDGWTLPEMPII